MNASRIPTEARPPRMEALARLPVFYALAGKRAVLAGGTPAAAWKAELLSAAGAEVDVLASAPGDEMLAVAADPPQGAIVLHMRPWDARDFAGAALAVGAFDDESEAERFAAAARAAGVPVNVIDKPAFCDFSFGSIVNRSPLVIGVSTDGAAPVFAQAIRAKLEALIPRGFARWAAAARRWRPDVKASGLTFAGRRQFWQRFTAHAVSHPDGEPAPADLERLLAATRAESATVEHGSVTLVGAGPGDPELLTLRAVRALQSADVILIDDLVAPGILDFARREAKKMLVGKTGFGPSCKQEEINTLMISLARSGKRVVRLKGGDPMIFGRAGEEIAACRAAGIAVEVVPGISAAQGAASRLGISLTHRRLARRVQYVTAHGSNGRLPSDIDWASVADPATTTVVYMPKKTLAELAAAAMRHGLAPDTPAIAVADATRPEQQVIAATIADIAERLGDTAPDGPVLVMIGRALAADAGVSKDRQLVGENPGPQRQAS
ncbi:MAG: uroporphyrin-III C-methyltransferase / precorrin-2 dehydrogenase / sirohydrochlorin ferrochelatase [Alphaproteobacteria bacterium]|nr:uroporphyrin-III C-methyltransferase / precorrin-2 dehydrogenase / sirohydrochlorin ferrochelatase [Alphaproteobacteria bacterium]